MNFFLGNLKQQLCLQVTGWEGMLQTGPADSLQHCAILAHSLMSQQFGMRCQSHPGHSSFNPE